MDQANQLVKLLKDPHISSEDILKEFDKLYQETDTSDKMFWKKLFICHATACDRNDVVRLCEPFFVSKDLNPLTIAVKKQNLELIEIFVNVGHRADEFEHEGFVMEYLDGEVVCAMDIAMMQDNVYVMQMLMNVHKNDRIVHLSIRRHAIKCFRELFKEVDTQDRAVMEKVYFPALLFDLDILKELVDLGYMDVNHKWGNGYGTSLHHAANNVVHQTRWRSNLTCYLTLIKYLLSSGAKAFVFNLQQKLPLDEALNKLNDLLHNPQAIQHCWEDLIHGCRLLIEAMKQETGLAFPVPLLSILRIWRGFDQVLVSLSSSGFQGSDDQIEQILSLYIDLAKLIFPYSDLHSGSGNCLESYDFVRNSAIFAEESKVLCYVLTFHKLLFIHGFEPVTQNGWFWFLFTVLKRKPPHLLDIVDMSLSLMDRDVLSQFQVYVKRRGITESGVSVDFRHSLASLCRRVLYNSVRHRKMINFVHSLQLPYRIKDYLLFGYKEN